MSMEAAASSHQAIKRAGLFAVVVFLLILEGRLGRSCSVRLAGDAAGRGGGVYCALLTGTQAPAGNPVK